MSKGLKKIYSDISKRYEFVNHMLTWGLDILWREKAAVIASRDGGTVWLDLCTGTGEMAANLERHGGDVKIISADFSIDMLTEAVRKDDEGRFGFALTDARALPFKDNTFDLVTVSFATRNLNVNRDVLVRTFREIRRILKPGGRFVNVETSQPPSSFVRSVFHIYTGKVIPPLGRIFGGSGPGYEFLAKTMLEFYDADGLTKVLNDAGFTNVACSTMMFGAAAVHVAR